MDEKETPMKYSDLYRMLCDLTPEQMNDKVVLYDTLTGAAYEPKKVTQLDEVTNRDDDIVIITF